jgi:hypothetical protein
MRYTPSQVRQAVGITQETLRHWRKSLASLSGLKGHAPAFRPSQLLGLAVVRSLIEDAGIGVRHLVAVEQEIFSICHASTWQHLARGCLVMTPKLAEVRFALEAAVGHETELAIVVPLKPIVDRLREALLEVSPDDMQQSLAFPPLDLSPASTVKKSAKL